MCSGFRRLITLMVSIYRVFKPARYSASYLMGILASRGQRWRGGVRVYCGHFIAKELETEFFNNLSSVHWLDNQGQVCNPRRLDTLPPRCFTGSGVTEAPLSPSAPPETKLLPRAGQGPRLLPQSFTVCSLKACQPTHRHEVAVHM